ncbi:hypothetical protein R1flu_014233 [Riccia fluitans]|uniref:Uncharacterized protein n=1 Tax=Riccia fluitans TaxID=41844 RepID=A0ABD1YIN6_9MARC
MGFEQLFSKGLKASVQVVKSKKRTRFEIEEAEESTEDLEDNAPTSETEEYMEVTPLKLSEPEESKPVVKSEDSLKRLAGGANPRGISTDGNRTNRENFRRILRFLRKGLERASPTLVSGVTKIDE